MKTITTILLFFAITCCTATPLHAQTAQELFEQGNAYYQQNQFDSAIESYEAVADSGYESAALYFNLANAYYKTNRLAPAILHYERAKRLAPNDKDIEFNLKVTQNLVQDDIEVLPEFFLVTWIKFIIQLASSKIWGIISIFTFAAALFLLLVFFFAQRPAARKLSFFAGILLFLFAVTTFFFSRQQHKKISTHNTAIVFQPSVTIKSAPDESGTDLFVLHEGTKVSIQDSLSNWYEIRIADGNVGWLKQSAIEKI